MRLSVSHASSEDVTEHLLRTEDVVLELELHGGLSWEPDVGETLSPPQGVLLSIDPPASLGIRRISRLSATAILLTLMKHSIFDTAVDTELRVSLINICAETQTSAAALVSEAMPCHSEVHGAPDAATLSASLPVLSGGSPAARPGAPRLVGASSYSEVLIVWLPPESSGDSEVSGYAWVEYVAGQPLITGDLVSARQSSDSTSLVAEMSGFQKGFGILPGALAAVNRGGFSDFSASWPSAEMGRPNVPPSLELESVGAGAPSTEFASRVWSQRLATESGNRVWLQRLAAEMGNRDWQQRLAAEIGNRDWQQRFAAETGRRDWQQRLATADHAARLRGIASMSGKWLWATIRSRLSAGSVQARIEML